MTITSSKANDCLTYILKSIQYTHALYHQAGQNTKRISWDENPIKGKLRFIFEGVPQNVKLLEFDDKTIYRYYVNSREVLEKIKEESALQVGNYFYVESEGDHYVETFPSLMGIHFTTPNFSAKDVGVTGSSYIDFTFNKGLSGLQLSEKVYLIPTKTSYTIVGDSNYQITNVSYDFFSIPINIIHIQI